MSWNSLTKAILVKNYSDRVATSGDTPEGVQSSAEGSRARQMRLLEIGDLSNKRILDVGCGLGHLYPLIRERFGEVDYTGVDIVEASLVIARKKYPEARYVCRDLICDPLEETFDYVLLCGLFNNRLEGVSDFLSDLVSVCYGLTEIGLGFNFISTHSNFFNDEMMYHDPAEIFQWAVKTLTPKIVLHHHYFRTDTVLFLYR